MFAEGANHDYLPLMTFRLRRRLTVLVAVGLFCFSIVGHGVVVGGASAKLIAALPSMGMSSDTSDGCDENGMTMHAACVALCASSVAILPVAIELSVVGMAREGIAASMGSVAGWKGAPDPYPPRLFV